MSFANPLGVDILEWKKAGYFYRRHRDRLDVLLHPHEMTFVRKSPRPQEAFALLFSAKEAVFKALGASFMGSSGFLDIRLFPKKNFSLRVSGRLKRNSPRQQSLKVSFKKTRQWVVATCHDALLPCVGI